MLVNNGYERRSQNDSKVINFKFKNQVFSKSKIGIHLKVTLSTVPPGDLTESGGTKGVKAEGKVRGRKGATGRICGGRCPSSRPPGQSRGREEHQGALGDKAPTRVNWQKSV